jgi:hypothetical protein
VGLALIFVTDRWAALTCIALITIGYSFSKTMAGASLQLATPARLRGLSSAFYFVIVSVIALGIGPVLVPLIAHGVLLDGNRIGDALGIVTIISSLSAFGMLIVALKAFRDQGAERATPAS